MKDAGGSFFVIVDVLCTSQRIPKGEDMFVTQNYIVASALNEAYEWNQKPKSTVLGGCGWLKMGRRAMSNAIDLSALGLNQITETEDCFELGAMVTLRQMETHEGLAAYFGDCIAASVRQIVGVQFRNGATIGGSIWGRFGFSDPLTLFLALGAQVVLYQAGIVALSDFVHMPYDRDILTAIRLPKHGQKAVYLSHRAAATDFPVLAVAVCETAEQRVAAVGARPMRAERVVGSVDEAAPAFAERCAEELTFSSNLRGSAEYRTHLCRVLVRRAVQALKEA